MPTAPQYQATYDTIRDTVNNRDLYDRVYQLQNAGWHVGSLHMIDSTSFAITAVRKEGVPYQNIGEESVDYDPNDIDGVYTATFTNGKGHTYKILTVIENGEITHTYINGKERFSNTNEG